MKTSEFLRKAKSLIDTPDKWTQGEFATDRNGTPVDPDSAAAQCFCSLGALWRQDTIYWATSQRVHLLEAMGGNIAQFNDNHSHAEVMSAWDKAIAAAEAGEAKGHTYVKE